MFLLIVWCNSSSFSECSDLGTYCDCYSTTCRVKSSTSSLEFEITITYGVGITIEMVVCLRKCNVVFNSSSNLLIFSSCSKILTSSYVGPHEAKGST